MAIAYRDSSQAFNTSTSTSLNITLPSGIVAGDGLLLMHTNGSATTETMTTPTGWTLVATTSRANIQTSLYKKLAQGGDAGSVIALTGSATTKRSAVCVAYSGVDSAIVDVYANATESVAGTTHTTPATTSTVATWAVEFVMDRAGPGSTSFTQPAGYTLRQTAPATGAAGCTTAVADSNGVLGSTSIGNHVWTGNVSTANAIMWTVALKAGAPAADYTIPGNYATAQSGKTSVTSLTTTLPRSVQTNDVALALIEMGSTQSADPTLPSGWALATTRVDATSASYALAWKALNSSDANTSVTFSWGTAGRAALLVQMYRGVDTSTPFDVISGSTVTTGNTSHATPSVTSTVAGWRVDAVAQKGSTVTAWSPPVGATSRGAVYGMKTASCSGMFADSAGNVVPGLQNSLTYTTDVTANNGACFTMVLKPSASAASAAFLQGDAVWTWAGTPTSDGFTVSARTTGATSVRLAVSTSSGMTSPSFTTAAAPDAQGYVRHAITGLSANTQYYYQFQDTPSGGSAVPISAVGKCKTLRASGSAASFVFGFGGCQRAESTVSTGLDNARAWGPDFFIHMGDFHYYDATETDQLTHARYFDSQINNAAGLKTFVRDVGTYYCRSDHDAGPGDNGDSNIASNQASINAYKQVVPRPGTLADTANPTEGLYHSWVVGRVRFIMVDIRNMNRTAGLTADSSSKTMLGATQKAWLKARLVDPEPVKVIVSDVGWIGPATTANGEDKWWSYDSERTEIGNYIRANNVHCILLHSDDHSLLADNGTNNLWGSFPVMAAAPFDNSGGGRSGTFQQRYSSGASDASQYGRMTVTDDGSTISFAYQGWDALTDTQKIAMTVTFPVLSPTEITSGEAFGTPTVIPGPVTISPAGIASGEAFGTPTVSIVAGATQTIYPVSIDSGEAFGVPALKEQDWVFTWDKVGFHWQSSRPLQYRIPVAISLLKIDGEWVEAQNPSEAMVKASTQYFPGGRIHIITGSVAGELIAAGYGDYVTLGD